MFTNLEELRKEIEKLEQEGKKLETLREEVKTVSQFKRLIVKEIGD